MGKPLFIGLPDISVTVVGVIVVFAEMEAEP
jgi:hypothetical protein